jgi:lambda repressor-like predicted transcriptional regulator
MKRWIAPFAGLLLAGAVAVPVFAQSQSADNVPQPADSSVQAVAAAPFGGAGAGMMICSTTTVTDIVAQALGMTPAELRLALVSGKTVTQLAADKNIDVQTIQDALATQRKADLDQALKDGLLTQTQYDRITQALQNAPALNGTARLGIRVATRNQVNRETVAADALGMTCADLVKAQQGGSSIAQVAVDKGVDVQTVIDALAKAYSDALAADVSEGLITQAQSDGQMTRLTVQIGQWVYDARSGRGNGFGFGGPGMGPQGFGNRDGMGQGFNGPNRGNGQPGMGNGQQGGFGNRGGQNGQNMPNPPQGFNQQNGQNAPQQPQATVTPNT